MSTTRDQPGAERLYAFVDRLAASQPAEEAPEPVEDWVLFEVAERSFCLPVSGVAEVLRVGVVTPGPGAPAAVAGVFSLRGRVLPVVDLATVLAGTTVTVDDATRILVLETRGRRLGALVSRALRLVKIAPSSVDASAADGPALGVVEQAGDRWTLLDIDRLLLIEDQDTA